ncbi:RagB/SusD family nutrient uptake outer membrane protein [Flexithrix dorotheae]|uniref:RagB/SusD family nutrient uptake outer membrane protein n=1 Tax=Flexithrix dorotheae TaxID=70993 RepID=UPI00036AFB47|nr:RagB/SusD family nutrient uptake outer membrane protein [Flexithrix dorotheae]
MKYISIILILTFSLLSCSDFLEEDLSAQLTPEGDALSNENGLTAALVGVYSPLTQTWIQGFGTAATLAILMGSDDLTTHKASNKAPFREFDQFKVSQQNGRLPFIWSGAYKSIQGSNNIIANYAGATGDQAVINHIGGEAHFMRAYMYFWIVRLWGKAPLVLNSHVYNEEILSIKSSDEQTIYNQIVSDLEEAIKLMGDTKPEPGRASRGTAKAMLAEVYLHMAGWPLKQTDKYAIAAQLAKEVIDNEATYNFGLMDNFADLWPTATSNNDGNKEEVFALNFAGTQWFLNNSIYGNAARPSDEGAWDDYMSEITFFNEFPEQLRKDITFQTELEDGTPWQEFLSARPYFKKIQGDRASWENALSLPLERMAEVYFVFAEAQIMATGNTKDASALEAVNKIVRRAYGLPINTPDPSVDYTEITQKQLIQEKAWEFAAEYVRWFDLTRLEMVEEVTAKKDPDDLQPLGPIKYYVPLPASETLVNPGLETGG